MKKLRILIIGIVLLCGAPAAAEAQSDTTQNITQAGNYRITVRGADGGNSNSRTTKGGSGATVAATFQLQAGDALTLVSGVAGQSVAFTGGGGGGSAVILTRDGTKTLLIVAGAGGGSGSSNSGGGGVSSQGSAGGGSYFTAGGGGGFNADAGGGLPSYGGKAGTLNGGGAGGTDANSDGGYGFGGGGAGSPPSSHGGGGGGGYGGGDGGAIGAGGRGGNGASSFIDASGTNQTRTDGVSGGGTNQNGSITVVQSTAASVSLSGRVLTNANRGLMNAIVYLTEADGNTRVARTSSFGYYRFENIAAGQTVIITVISKQHQFAPQVLTVTEEIENLDFVALTPLREK